MDLLYKHLWFYLSFILYCPPSSSLLNPVLFSLPFPFLEFLAYSSILLPSFLGLLQVTYYNLRTQSWDPQIRENITQETFSRSRLPPSITFSSSIYLPANVMIHFFFLYGYCLETVSSIHDKDFAPMKSKYRLLNKICIITPVGIPARMEKSHKTQPLDEAPQAITGC